MSNVLRLPTESNHFQTFVFQDRIAAGYLSPLRPLLHFPVRQNM
jgi:hypothetical protein